MLRQAARVTRICVASSRPLQWPPHLAPACPRLRHVRLLQTSPCLGFPEAQPTHSAEPPCIIDAAGPPSARTDPNARQPPGTDPFPSPAEQHLPQNQHANTDPRDAQPGLVRKEDNTKRWRPARPFLREYSKKVGVNLKDILKDVEAWDKEFGAIWERLEDRREWRKFGFEQHSIGTQLLEELLASKTIHDMSVLWSTKSAETRRCWPSVMMECMKLYPDKTSEVLQATLRADEAPPWIVSDIFCFLVQWPACLPPHRQREQQEKLPGLVSLVLKEGVSTKFWFRQWVLGKIFSVCSAPTAAALHAELNQYQHLLHWNTKFHLARALAEDVAFKPAALEILEETIKQGRRRPQDRRCEALATSILTIPADWDKGQGSPVDPQVIIQAFERLIGLGLSPNIVTCTAMMRTFCVSGQLGAAWRIYGIIKSQGMPLDAHVFTALLDGANRTCSLDAAVRVLEEVPHDVWQSPVMWTELLDTILTLASFEARTKGPRTVSPVPAFRTMLEVYAKFFKLQHLQHILSHDLRGVLAATPRQEDVDHCEWKLRLSSFLDELPVASPDNLATPDIRILSIMLIAYVRSFSTVYPVLSFYSRFRNLLKERDPIALALTSHNTLVFDTILHALVDQAGMLRVAVDIVNDMMSSAEGSAVSAESDDTISTTIAELREREAKNTQDPIMATGEVERAADAAPTQQSHSAGHHKPGHPIVRLPAPSVYTWSILMQAFLRQRRKHQAMRVLRVMRALGVEPDRVTYNILVYSYSAAQKTQGVIETLDQLDHAGYHPDAHTFRGVSKLEDPEPALQLMETRAAERAAQRWREINDSTAAALPQARPENEAKEQGEAAAENKEARQEPSNEQAEKAIADKQQSREHTGQRRRIKERHAAEAPKTTPQPAQQPSKEEVLANARAFLERLDQSRRIKLQRIAKERMERITRLPLLHEDLIMRMTSFPRLRDWEDFVVRYQLDPYVFKVSDRERRARLRFEGGEVESQETAEPLAATSYAVEDMSTEELESLMQGYEDMAIAKKPAATTTTTMTTTTTTARKGSAPPKPHRSSSHQHHQHQERQQQEQQQQQQQQPERPAVHPGDLPPVASHAPKSLYWDGFYEELFQPSETPRSKDLDPSAAEAGSQEA
ncbi:hypothetical protein VTJ83DRAFT_7360 [Remersonia thermophila]|uniref:Pentatricopeptide repeat protein n=1 Tax=Remersonia thermophila TaxID=72144 RepID=A0ABR4D3A2_9PEZI